MNGPEKKVFILALFLFGLGALVRFSPWDPVPQIETFPYAEESPAAFGRQGAEPGALSVADPSRSKAKHRRTHAGKPKIQVHFPISVNRATAEELCAIKGIGPKLAAKIIAFRTDHGPFGGPADLRKVSGIGEKKAKSYLAYLVFD